LHEKKTFFKYCMIINALNYSVRIIINNINNYTILNFISYYNIWQYKMDFTLCDGVGKLVTLYRK